MHNRKHLNFQKGFTFIEIMVVVTISMVMAGFGLAKYNDFRMRQTIIRAAENFATELRTVQKRADAGERVDACIQLNNYLVTKDANNNTVTFQDSCTAGGGTNGDTIKLGSGTVFSAATYFSIEFPVLSGDVIVSPVGYVIGITDLSGTCTSQVIISPAGEISANPGDPADPNKCN